MKEFSNCFIFYSSC